MKIYVRERIKSKEGGHSPRYRIIASQGGDLRFHADHLRKVDIETIAKDLGAQVVYLPEREHAGKKEKGEK
jgi:hypothetical protein